MLPHLSKILTGFSCVLYCLTLISCVGRAQVAGRLCVDSNCLYGDGYCNSFTGQCLYGCKPGYVGSTCSATCAIPECKECIRLDATQEQCTRCYANNYYGPRCQQRCSANCRGMTDTCDHFGNCLHGCYDPFIGPKCTEQNCTIPDCTVCGRLGELVVCAQCKPGFSVHQYGCIGCPGHCLLGNEDCMWSDDCKSESCLSGWTGSTCNEPCTMDSCQNCTRSNGKDRCATCEPGLAPSSDRTKCVACSDRCEGQCDPSTGACVEGCKPGWYGANNRCDHFCDISNCSRCELMPDGSSTCAQCDEMFYTTLRMCSPCRETCRSGGTQVCHPSTGVCLNGCEDGWYGDRCWWRCSEHCIVNTCEFETGSCTCAQDWYGDRCDRVCPVHCTDCLTNFRDGICAVCEAGWHGQVCDKKCSPNCRNKQFKGYSFCDRDSGRCSDGCSSGMYGDTCNMNCSKNCDSESCRQDDGHCVGGCSVNWYGAKCDQQCSDRCQYSTSGHTRSCDIFTGKCHACKAGFYGDNCASVCSPNCGNSVCEQYSGVCAHGCKQGYSGSKCEVLCRGTCPSDCGPNCLYDSCSLSTLTCQLGCVKGWYGATCQKICSAGCTERDCNWRSGNCALGCVTGSYGSQCDRPCGVHCLGSVCDMETGRCLKDCESGYYGDWCNKRCPDACFSVTCNRVSGACDRCGIGLMGSKCEQDCYPGYYGENCEYMCGHCRNGGQCYPDDGRCPMGCDIGWMGSTCAREYVMDNEVTEMDTGIKAAIGSSVMGVVCCLVIIAGVCWWKRKSQFRKKKNTPELHVTYSNLQAHIETVHQSSTSLTGNQPVTENQPNGGNQGDDGGDGAYACILGDSSGASQIQLGDKIWEGTIYSLHKGTVLRNRLQQTKCCVKLVQLTCQDVNGPTSVLNRLLQETEILRLCGHHSNITNMITMYHSKDVFCVAMDTSLETGLLAYLRELETGSGVTVVKPAAVDQLLQFTADICTAVTHIHKLKVIHRALRAGHVYLSNTRVAKVGDFDWAERTDLHEPTDTRSELPTDFSCWLAPESLMRNEFSCHSDMWSLGMLVWEIFSLGRTPYQGLSLDQQRQEVLDGVRPPKPSSANFIMYRLMKGCWRYDPSDRPSPEHLLQQLQAIQVSRTMSPVTGNRQAMTSNGEVAQSCPNNTGASHPRENTDRAISNSAVNIGRNRHDREDCSPRAGVSVPRGRTNGQNDQVLQRTPRDVRNPGTDSDRNLHLDKDLKAARQHYSDGDNGGNSAGVHCDNKPEDVSKSKGDFNSNNGARDKYGRNYPGQQERRISPRAGTGKRPDELPLSDTGYQLGVSHSVAGNQSEVPSPSGTRNQSDDRNKLSRHQRPRDYTPDHRLGVHTSGGRTPVKSRNGIEPETSEKYPHPGNHDNSSQSDNHGNASILQPGCDDRLNPTSKISEVERQNGRSHLSSPNSPLYQSRPYSSIQSSDHSTDKTRQQGPQNKPYRTGQRSPQNKPYRNISPGPQNKPYRNISPGPQNKPYRNISPGPQNKPYRNISPGPQNKPYRNISPGPQNKPYMNISPSKERHAHERLRSPNSEMASSSRFMSRNNKQDASSNRTNPDKYTSRSPDSNRPESSAMSSPGSGNRPESLAMRSPGSGNRPESLAMRAPGSGNRPESSAMRSPGSGNRPESSAMSSPGSGNRPESLAMRSPGSGNRPESLAMRSPGSGNRPESLAMRSPGSGNRPESLAMRSPGSGNRPPNYGESPKWDSSVQQSPNVDIPASHTIKPLRDTPEHPNLRSPDQDRPTSRTSRALNFDTAVVHRAPSNGNRPEHRKSKSPNEDRPSSRGSWSPNEDIPTSPASRSLNFDTVVVHTAPHSVEAPSVQRKADVIRYTPPSGDTPTHQPNADVNRNTPPSGDTPTHQHNADVNRRIQDPIANSESCEYDPKCEVFC